MGDDICDEADATDEFARDNRHLRHGLDRSECRLDLAGFNTEAADLNLLIGSAQELEIAITSPPGQITRAIHA